MSNQTEREKFSTLATDINRALERNDDEEYYRLTHSHPVEILKALRLAALDGGAVSQKPFQCLICGAKHSGWSKADLDEWQKLVSPLRQQGRHPFGVLRSPQRDGGAVSQGRDLLIRFATWFDRCSERPLHAHEISDSIDAFLAAEKEPRE